MQAAPQGQDAAQQLQSVLAQAALLQQLQAHQSAHSQLMQLLQLNQLVQASSGSADAAGALPLSLLAQWMALIARGTSGCRLPCPALAASAHIAHCAEPAGQTQGEVGCHVLSWT